MGQTQHIGRSTLAAHWTAHIGLPPRWAAPPAPPPLHDPPMVVATPPSAVLRYAIIWLWHTFESCSPSTQLQPPSPAPPTLTSPPLTLGWGGGRELDCRNLGMRKEEEAGRGGTQEASGKPTTEAAIEASASLYGRFMHCMKTTPH